MGKVRHFGLFAFLATLAYGGCAVSFAAEGAQRIAVVDLHKAVSVVEAGKKGKAQLEKEFNTKTSELEKEKAAINKMGEELQKQSLVMNEEARAKKQSELQSRVMKLQQNYQQFQEEIQNKERSLTMPIVTKLKSIVAELAKKKNYNLVLEKNEMFVVYSEEKDDLTNEVISIFDKGGHK